ncbi:MAG: glycoside hydrolase family 15 protein, partial [Lentisphaerae bacterium]|nr:glycoside hydrolase family 15 protein [Lentisphaerota bacterium]
LLMASYGFIEPDDPKFVSTVRKIRKELAQDGLMFRYKNDDDFGTPTSSFTVCSFWMVKALWQIGEREEAERMFERLLGYANHLGLFSEDLDFKTKEMLGNFPQGYSHLALIDCAILLGGIREGGPTAPGKL